MEKIYSYMNNMSQDLPVDVLLVNFLLCLLYAFSLKLLYTKVHYRENGGDLESNILMYASLITFLVVSVIQTSLMLSLGMVGALSIIRFRTPLKDPSDLVYMFFAISIGVAFAASKFITAIIIITSIMVFILIFEGIFSRKGGVKNTGVLMLEYSVDPSELQSMLKVAGENNLIRYDERGDKCVIWITTKVDKVQEIVESFTINKSVLVSKTFSTKLNN
jgi:hypothetical protein